jgi:hypothetical protein
MIALLRQLITYIITKVINIKHRDHASPFSYFYNSCPINFVIFYGGPPDNFYTFGSFSNENHCSKLIHLANRAHTLLSFVSCSLSVARAHIRIL